MARTIAVAGFLMAAPGFAAESAVAGGANPGANAGKAIDLPASAGLPEVREVLQQFQSVMQQQAQQLDEQRREIEEQREELKTLRDRLLMSAPGDRDANSGAPAADLSAAAHALTLTPSSSSSVTPFVRSGLVHAAGQTAPSAEAEAPLSIKIGNAQFTPGGWADFTALYRSTDVGSGLGTSFASIPFSNTVQGGLSETRFTAQSSRVTLKVDETVGKTKAYGYAEADFNGYLPSNAYVSTNGSSLRLRVYFLNLSRGRWDLLGGQSWSLLTPNRVGVSPFLPEIFNTLHLDTNYQVGLTYARQAQLRAVYHATENVALGLSIENPEQLTGGGVSFPALFNTAEVDVNSSSGAGGNTATPNLHPDVVAKIAVDKKFGGRSWHLETAGLLTGIRVYTPASVTKGAPASDIREGGGISANANLEVVRNFHLIANSYWSDGGSRYINGLGPAFVVSQNGSPTAPFEAQLMHSGSGMGGFEWKAVPSTILSAYYGGAYFQRFASLDPSSKTPLLVGYGFPGSANTNNRAIQEGTISTVTTLWKRPPFGALQFITQSSYVTRAPWSVAPGAPKNAHTFMEFANIRYVLP